MVLQSVSGPTPLDVRRQRNRDSMRRARVRQRAEKVAMQQRITQLESRLRHLIQSAAEQKSSSSSYGQLLLQTEQLRREKKTLEDQLQQHEDFQRKLGQDTDEELEERTKDGHLEGDGGQDDAGEGEDIPGRPAWMSVGTVRNLLHFATDMFLSNAERTDETVIVSNLVLGWRDKRAVVEDTWAQFLLTKDFPHQFAASLVERTWNATVDVDKLREMLKWTAGMKVLHRLSEHAYVVTRDLHLPNSVDPDVPIRYRYELLVFRAETANGFIISTQNIKWCDAEHSTVEQMLDQGLLRQVGLPLVTMYGFLFERQFCQRTGEVIGCRVKLAGRTSDGSLSYAHKVLIEALPSILRWENSYVGPILCITPDESGQ